MRTVNAPIQIDQGSWYWPTDRIRWQLFSLRPPLDSKDHILATTPMRAARSTLTEVTHSRRSFRRFRQQRL